MRLVFMGTPAAAVPSLARCLSDGHDVAAVYTQPDRPAGRGNKLTSPPVKEFAIARGIPVLQPTKIRTPETLETYISHAADVAIVVAYGRILPATLLNAYPQGAINVHFSLLPRYRGAAPVNWAIANGESVTGVTTMKMDEGLDTGDILIQRETPIGRTENSIELMERLSVLGSELLSETLSRLKDIVPTRQDESHVSYAPILKKTDGVIDWSRPAVEIVNRVRAFQPFPSSYTFVRGAKLTIFAATAVGADQSSTPGTVVSAGNDGLVIAAGFGSAVAVVELQIEGKRRLPVHDFLNGVKFGAGDILGT